MTAWKRWRPQRWHGWAVCSPQRFDAAQERGITSVRSGVSSEMLFLSFSKLVSRILWLNKICENKTESGSRNVKTRSSSKFGQVTPQICWLILKVFLLSNTLPAFLSPGVLETPPYAVLRTTWHEPKEPEANFYKSRNLTTPADENSRVRFNMFQPELIAIAADALRPEPGNLAKRQNSFTLFMTCSRVFRSLG